MRVRGASFITITPYESKGPHHAKGGFVNTFGFMQTEDFGMHFLLYAMLGCAFLASGFERVSIGCWLLKTMHKLRDTICQQTLMHVECCSQSEKKIH